MADIHDIYGEKIGTIFQCIVVIQSRGEGVIYCCNFITPGSQSVTYTLLQQMTGSPLYVFYLCTVR